MSSSVSNQITKEAPQPVARIADVMSGFSGAWSLCGGWAVDAWLGRETRHHGDIDISVFEVDLPELLDHLAGWQLVAHDKEVVGDTSELWNGRPLLRPAHIHGRFSNASLPERLDAAAGFDLDIQIDATSGDDFVASRKHNITLPLGDCTQQSGWGLPTLTPPVLLFYKAKLPRSHDEQDFLALLPHLDKVQRTWLSEAVSLVRADHPWLAQLAT
ncbi:MAG: hypothetical protein WEB04_04285 [Dehalococcoidia bacterium]